VLANVPSIVAGLTAIVRRQNLIAQCNASNAVAAKHTCDGVKKLQMASKLFAIVRVKSALGYKPATNKNEWVRLLAVLTATEQLINHRFTRRPKRWILRLRGANDHTTLKTCT
jgi:hypothetical protein